MLDFPLWRRIFLWAVTLAFVALALPSVTSLSGQKWPSSLPDPEVNLGLDLAGGSHILLEAERDQVARQRLEILEEAVIDKLKDAEPRIRIGDISTAGGRLSFMLEDASQVDAAREEILPELNGTGTVQEWTLAVEDGNRFIITQTEQGLDQAVTQAMDSAVDVIRRRIDDLGTREPTIIRQGDTRIVVQVPGLEDPQALKDLLGKTARLEFKLVDTQALPSEIQDGTVRAGSQIYPYADSSDFAGSSIAVKRLGGIRGDNLTGAQQSFDQQTNEPVVSINFDSRGGVQFCQLTQRNVNKPFAIILDGVVLSAPNINEPICGGSAQISGGFSVETANNLAISLRSGALPVDLAIIEERTVGPDLGADSIKRGMVAMGLGSLLVVLLMIVTYGRFGIYATIALVINVLMILGIMAALNATLTLPGIAGFVLTIGAAVDANVLIYERIREERKKGRRVIAAVENGYKEASRAIYDANITNAIAGMLLFAFGSGPIKGFAVVLMIGLVTSVFTGVTLTRMWVASWLRAKRPTEINV